MARSSYRYVFENQKGRAFSRGDVEKVQPSSTRRQQ
jgi:hypothetical protein